MSSCRSLVLKVLRTEPQGSARNLLWGSVNNDQPLHGLHYTKRLRTTDVDHKEMKFVELDKSDTGIRLG